MQLGELRLEYADLGRHGEVRRCLRREGLCGLALALAPRGSACWGCRRGPVARWGRRLRGCPVLALLAHGSVWPRRGRPARPCAELLGAGLGERCRVVRGLLRLARLHAVEVLRPHEDLLGPGARRVACPARPVRHEVAPAAGAAEPLAEAPWGAAHVPAEALLEHAVLLVERQCCHPRRVPGEVVSALGAALGLLLLLLRQREALAGLLLLRVLWLMRRAVLLM